MILNGLSEEKRNKILGYLNLVIKKNNDLNLTKIDTVEQGIILHIEDSLSVLQDLSLGDGPFLDIGTGGGFPGVPLAIASDRTGVLIDSIAKKAHAVEEMVHELGIEKQIYVHAIRSEDFALEHARQFSTVVSRAVAALPVVEEFACPFLSNGGRFIAMRGKLNQTDLDASLKAAEILGLELESKRQFLLNDLYERNILIFIKTKESKISLPRRNGMAQKRPIVK